MLFICKRRTCLIEASLIAVEFKKDEPEKLIRFNVKAHSQSGLWTYDEVLKINLNPENEEKVWDIRDEIGRMVMIANQKHGVIDTDVIRDDIFNLMKERHGRNNRQ